MRGNQIKLKDNNMWTGLIKSYWQVSLFKKAPEDTPYSLILLAGLALFYFVIITVQWNITDVKHQITWFITLMAGTALIASYVLYTYILLAVFRVTGRLVQTLTCLFAGHTIVHLFAFPLLLAIPLLTAETIPKSFGALFGIIYLILTLMLTVWQFMITTYIYKHALEVDYLPAVFASLGLLAANILTISFWQ